MIPKSCNSHYVSHFAAFFIVVGAQTSIAESCNKLLFLGWQCEVQNWSQLCIPLSIIVIPRSYSTPIPSLLSFSYSFIYFCSGVMITTKHLHAQLITSQYCGQKHLHTQLHTAICSSQTTHSTVCLFVCMSQSHNSSMPWQVSMDTAKASSYLSIDAHAIHGR